MRRSGKFAPIWRTVVAIGLFLACGRLPAFEENNRFAAGTFPVPVSKRVFSIPLAADQVVVVLPPQLMVHAPQWRTLLKTVSGEEIPVKASDRIDASEIAARHLVVVGHLSNNRWARQLYLRRQAFADAYFPGRGGVIVHPTTSPWNRDRNILVVGYSRDEDGPQAVAEFFRLLGKSAREIPNLHSLKTSLAFPRPPDSVKAVLTGTTRDLLVFPPYREVAFWGLAYYLSGDERWARHFRDGFHALYERSRISGQWVPEPWTTLYFDLWRLYLVWGLLDEDPVFSADDRTIAEELLWNYTRVIDSNRNFPHFRPDAFIADDIRQNHTTFVALDLFCAYRYYREKYDLKSLEALRLKFEPAFASQMDAVRSNDDAGFGYWANLVFGYMYLTPNHAMLFRTLQGDEAYLKKSHLRRFADLLVTLTDNRRDGASFGDVSGYSHRSAGAPRGMTEKYLEVAAAAARDGGYQWMYNWLAGDSSFDLNNMFDGEYAVEMDAKPPDRFLGVHPVLLDEAALRWVGRRAEDESFLPIKGRRYFDKMSFRSRFDPEDEYLLMDGTSTFAHGHQDGNTVVRLTWKDRIWLFDLDYIQHTPRYHNGIVVVRDGVQEPPPPLTSLEYAADFPGTGFSRTQSTNFNGADWQRNVIWKKGKYFLFLDEIKARTEGRFRLECRWRTKGETELVRGDLTVRQGGKQFHIRAADESARSLKTEKEDYWNGWDYPWGKGAIQVLTERRDASMRAGESRVFANLMYATDGPKDQPIGIRSIDRHTYLVRDADESALMGIDSAFLARGGMDTDASFFYLDPERMRLVNTTSLIFGDVSIRAPVPVHLGIDFRKSQAVLQVAATTDGEFVFGNCGLEKSDRPPARGVTHVRLHPGRYLLSFRSRVPAMADLIRQASTGMPSFRAKPFPSGTSATFGLELEPPFLPQDEVTSFFPEGDSLLFGDRVGRIGRVTKEGAVPVRNSDAKAPITVLRSADLNGDGQVEIVAADSTETLFALTASGKLLWSAKLTKFFGENANAVDIAVLDGRTAEDTTIYVASKGFKLSAFNGKGRLKWETLIRYHPQTRIKAVREDRRTQVAVGTVYSTPLNLVDGATGKVGWYTWEQMGDEVGSTTDYCGFALTDMVFSDLDRDGKKEIVFGTKYNRVYALNTADGATVWEANVGDEVTALRDYQDPGTGEMRLLVGTEAGDLLLLDHRGRRKKTVALEAGIAAVEIVPHPGFGKTDFVAATRDGRVVVCDEELIIRAAGSVGVPVIGMAPAGEAGMKRSFFLIADRGIYRVGYRPYFLRKSRYY